MIRLPIIYVVYYLKMGKINYIKLRAQAIILASEGYSHSVIGKKLQRSKRWVTKWVVRGRVNDTLIDRKRSGRSKILSNAAKRLISATKYKRGHGVRCNENQLKVHNQVVVEKRFDATW